MVLYTYTEHFMELYKKRCIHEANLKIGLADKVSREQFEELALIRLPGIIRDNMINLDDVLSAEFVNALDKLFDDPSVAEQINTMHTLSVLYTLHNDPAVGKFGITDMNLYLAQLVCESTLAKPLSDIFVVKTDAVYRLSDVMDKNARAKALADFKEAFVKNPIYVPLFVVSMIRVSFEDLLNAEQTDTNRT